MTGRGVRWGMNADAVINAYGHNYNKNKKDDIIYSYKNFKLTFHAEKGKVGSIIMDEGIEDVQMGIGRIKHIH